MFETASWLLRLEWSGLTEPRQNGAVLAQRRLQDGATNRLKRFVNHRLSVCRGDRPLLCGQREWKDTAFNDCTAHGHISREVVMFGDIVPVDWRMVHKVDAER